MPVSHSGLLSEENYCGDREKTRSAETVLFREQVLVKLLLLRVVAGMGWILAKPARRVLHT